jgi:cytochrome P450
MELDPYSEEFFHGAWETYRHLRDKEPVHHNERLNFWALSRYDDVSAAFRDWSTFSSAQGTMMDQLDTPGFSREMMPGWLLVYDPPDHSRLRRLAAAAFTPRSVQDLTAAVDLAVTSAFDSVAGSKEFDLVESVVKRIPAEVMYDLMGIPLDGREHAMTLTEAFLYAGDGDGGDINEARIAAMMELSEYLMSIVQEKRVKPGDDIMSRMIQARFVDEEGTEQRLTDTEMCYYLLLLLAAGTETTAKLTCGAVVGLHRNRDQWQLLLDDPGQVKAAALEAGRHESPVQIIGRRCVKETTLHGTTIPAGANVYLLIGSANRDERVYPNPESFDLTRSFDPLPITYGWGPHLCLGKHLALLEVETTLEQLRARWPHFEIDESRLQRVHGFQVFGWSKVPVFI